MKPFTDLVTFYYTNNLEETHAFYHEMLELPLAVDQGSCSIYRVSRGGFVGFCERTHTRPEDDQVIITFVTEDVDGWYEKLLAKGVKFEKIPQENQQYGIYHCFFRDNNGYLLEVQRFLDEGWRGPNIKPLNAWLMFIGLLIGSGIFILVEQNYISGLLYLVFMVIGLSIYLRTIR